MIVNETAARRFWPGDDPIGKRIRGFDPRGTNDDWITVIGVVRDVRSRGLEQTPLGQIFEAQAQSLDETEHVVVATIAATGMAAALREAIATLDKTAVFSDVATINDVLDDQSSERRFETTVLGSFGGIALLLACAGIFGVLHYSVQQRRAEMGIRLALGAQQGHLISMIVREGLQPVAIGIAIGVAGSLVLARGMSGLLFGVSAQDPMTYITVCLIITAVALIASLAPAARASRGDVAEIIGAE